MPIEFDYKALKRLYFRPMLLSLFNKNGTVYLFLAHVVMGILVGIPLTKDPKADSFGVFLFATIYLYILYRCVYVIWNTLIHPNEFYKGINKIAIDVDGICFIHEAGRYHKVGWKGVVGVRYWKDLVLIDFTALPTFIVDQRMAHKDLVALIEKYKNRIE